MKRRRSAVSGFPVTNRGFTLIELLVVIAIIAILAAMLLPALRAARARGQAANCIGGLGQVGKSIQMYADLYKGYSPPTIGGNGVNVNVNADSSGEGVTVNTGNKVQSMFPHLGGNPTNNKWQWYHMLMYTGTMPKPSVDIVTAIDSSGGTPVSSSESTADISHIMVCPTVSGTQNQSKLFSYGLNEGLGGVQASTPRFRAWRRIDNVLQPSKVFMAGDRMLYKNAPDQPGGSTTYANRAGFYGSTSGIYNDFRHGNRCNMVHADGHVAALSYHPNNWNVLRVRNYIREIDTAAGAVSVE